MRQLAALFPGNSLRRAAPRTSGGKIDIQPFDPVQMRVEGSFRQFFVDWIDMLPKIGNGLNGIMQFGIISQQGLPARGALRERLPRPVFWRSDSRRIP